MKLSFSSPVQKVSLGPVLGLIDHSSAVILFEFEHSLPVIVTLEPEIELNPIVEKKPPEKKTISRKVSSKTPEIFEFSGLEPSTLYKVNLNCPVRSSSFRTFSKNQKHVIVALVSCNNILDSYEQHICRSPWTELASQCKDEKIQMVLHLGNNVYLDREPLSKNIWEKSKGILAKSNSKESQEIVKELIKSVYRETWSYPSTAVVLAHVPSIFHMNTRDIKEDWIHSFENDGEETPEVIFCKIAHEVFWEYCGRLRGSSFSQNQNGFFALNVNGISFLFLDYGRSRLSLLKKQKGNEKKLINSKLGSEQWEWLEENLKKDGSLKEASRLLLVSPVPVVFFGEMTILEIEMIKAEKQKMDKVSISPSLLTHWGFLEKDEQGKLLNLISDWKKCKAGREVGIVCPGNDIHCSIVSSIQTPNNGQITQVISSPIGKEAGKDYFVMNEIENGQKGELEVESSFGKTRFFHSEVYRKNNFVNLAMLIGSLNQKGCLLVDIQKNEGSPDGDEKDSRRVCCETF